ncbi:MAG: hypothetical protein AAB782_00700 [Patescibacteria group bacterium]
MEKIEKILVLLANRTRSQELRERMKRWGVDVVDTLAHGDIVPLGELEVRYNIIVVDKRFQGNSQDTAKLVRRMRREFLDPIIGIDEGCAGDGELFDLQLAGCNFMVYPNTWEKTWGGILDTIQEIHSK